MKSPHTALAGELACRGQALVAVDSRVEGVSLPASLMGLDWVLLHVGADLTIPAPVKLAGTGFFCTLLFRGTPFAVVVPWTAVRAVGDEARVRSTFPALPPAPAAPEPKPVVPPPTSGILPQHPQARKLGWRIFVGGKYQFRKKLVRKPRPSGPFSGSRAS
jgi:hypothetical protein